MKGLELEALAPVDRHQSDGVQALGGAWKIAQIPLVGQDHEPPNVFQKVADWITGFFGQSGAQEVLELPQGKRRVSIVLASLRCDVGRKARSIQVDFGDHLPRGRRWLDAVIRIDESSGPQLDRFVLAQVPTLVRISNRGERGFSKCRIASIARAMSSIGIRKRQHRGDARQSHCSRINNKR